MRRHFLHSALYVLAACFLVGAEEPGSVTNPWAAYFSGSPYLAARITLDSTGVFVGTLEVSSNNSERIDGLVRLNQIVYGEAKGAPRSIAFSRRMNFGALAFGESKVMSVFHRWNHDMSSDSKVLIFASDKGGGWTLLKVIPLNERTKDILQDFEIVRTFSKGGFKAMLEKRIDGIANPLAAAIRVKILQRSDEKFP